MRAQGGNRVPLTKLLKKANHRCPTVFKKFDKTHDEIHISIMKNK